MRTQLAFAFLLALVSTSAHGQIFQNGEMFGGEAPNRKQLLKMVERSLAGQKKMLGQRVELRIDEIDRTCKLDKKQSKKLRLAGAGALRRMLDATEKQLRLSYGIDRRVLPKPAPTGPAVPKPPGAEDEVEEATARPIPAEPRPTEPEAPVNDDEVAEAPNVPQPGGWVPLQAANAVNDFVVEFEMNGAPVQTMHSHGSSFEAQPLWKKALEKILTDEQAEKLKVAEAKRQAYRRSAGVRNFVNGADRRLLLSPEQREKLEGFLDKTYGKMFGQPGGYPYLALGNLNKKAVGKFLSPAQMKLLGTPSSTYSPFDMPQVAFDPAPVFAPPAVFPQAPAPDRPYLGVQLDGLRLKQVLENSPAENAGLKVDDIIVSIGDQKFETMSDFIEAIQQQEIGGTIKVTIKRDGKSIVVEPKLANSNDF